MQLQASMREHSYGMQGLLCPPFSEGQPLEGASVQFFPEDRDSRWGSGETTDSSGNVSIRTLGKYNGAPAGRYTVNRSISGKRMRFMS